MSLSTSYGTHFRTSFMFSATMVNRGEAWRSIDMKNKRCTIVNDPNTNCQSHFFVVNMYVSVLQINWNMIVSFRGPLAVYSSLGWDWRYPRTRWRFAFMRDQDRSHFVLLFWVQNVAVTLSSCSYIIARNNITDCEWLKKRTSLNYQCVLECLKSGNKQRQ